MGERYRFERVLPGRGPVQTSAGRDLDAADAADGGRVELLRLPRRGTSIETELDALLTHRSRHPHVAVVLDVADDGDDHWLVTAPVDGTTLAETSDGAPLAPARVAGLLAPVAEALADGHERGHAHGGVSASSIVLDVDDRATLAPFGLGEATGAPADDVAALGTAIYQACAGTTIHGTLPPGHPLASVVASATDPDAAGRPTAAELGRRLHRVAGTGPRRRPVTIRPRAQLAIAASVVAVVGVGTVIAFDAEDSGSPAVAAPTDRARTVDGVVVQGDDATDPQERELVDFAIAYVADAVADPARGWDRLTPEYRVLLGDRTAYDRTWDGVEDLRIRRIDADVERLRVTFISGFERDGDPRTATIVLHLERRGTGLLVGFADTI